jgi:hypothetical protein
VWGLASFVALADASRTCAPDSLLWYRPTQSDLIASEGGLAPASHKLLTKSRYKAAAAA